MVHLLHCDVDQVSENLLLFLCVVCCLLFDVSLRFFIFFSNLKPSSCFNVFCVLFYLFFIPTLRPPPVLPSPPPPILARRDSSSSSSASLPFKKRKHVQVFNYSIISSSSSASLPFNKRRLIQSRLFFAIHLWMSKFSPTNETIPIQIINVEAKFQQFSLIS